MSEQAVVTTEKSEITQSLPDRLDSAIGDASSGIGVLMSELVRRSLRTGVADIEHTLAEVTAEKVDLAIDLQMPAINESAHRVAETTSAKIVKTAVTECEQRTSEQLQNAVCDFEEAIKKTSEENRQQAEKTQEEITEFESRAQASWKMVKNNFASLNANVTALEAKLTESGQEITGLQNQLAAAAQENSTLKSTINGLSGQVRQLEGESSQAQTNLEALLAQNAQLVSRLEELEKPRGLKKMWQNLGFGRRKQKKIEGSDD